MTELVQGPRQGEKIVLYFTFINSSGALEPQPTDYPLMKIEYIDPVSGNLSTTVEETGITEIEPGRYYYEWNIPLDAALTQYQILTKGVVESSQVIKDRVMTVLESAQVCYPEVAEKGEKCNYRYTIVCSNNQSTEPNCGSC